MNNTLITVMLCEPDVSYRQHTYKELSRQGNFRIVCTTSCERNMLTRAATLKPAVVVVDPNLDRAESLARIRRLKERLPNAKILVYTNRDDKASLVRALQAGARGYLLKRYGPKSLADGIVETTDGGTPISPYMVTYMIDYLPQPAPKKLYNLSCRDLNILRMLADGIPRKGIADQLSLSLDGVKKSLTKIYGKLEVSSGREATAKALKEGLI
jgi:DNA-binding NarL/FixJ family response regulator